MKNKNSICAASGLILATALFTTQPSVAASTLTFTGFEYGSVDVNLATNPPVPAAAVTHANAGAFNANINGGPTFEAFCLDVWQFLSFNQSYSLGIGSDYTYRPSLVGYTTTSGTLTQGAIDNLSRLYTEAHSSIIGNATNSAAFQLAVWEIAYETPNNYNLASGNFYSTGPAGVTSITTGWLTNLANYAPDLFGQWLRQRKLPGCSCIQRAGTRDLRDDAGRPRIDGICGTPAHGQERRLTGQFPVI